MSDTGDAASRGSVEVFPAGGLLALAGDGRDPWPILVQLWLDSGFAAKTREAYSRAAAEWATACEHWQIHPLAAGRPHVDRWMREMENGAQSWLPPSQRRPLASTTRARKLASLASVFSYAAGERLIPASPVDRVKRPKATDRHKAPGMSSEQARALLAAAAADSPRTEALLRLLLTNVLRISEALALDVEDLGEERGHRTLRIMGKGSKAATVPLAPPVAEAIDRYLDGRAEGPLFATSTGKRIDRAAVHRTIGRLARRSGLAGLSLSSHSMRATGITLFMDTGGTLRDAQKLARHADPRTTEGYDRARHNLDSHGSYRLAGVFAE